MDLPDVGAPFWDGWSYIFVRRENNEILLLGKAAEALSFGSAEVVGPRA
jgi:hypothetical protein